MGLGMLRILGSHVFFHPDFVQNKLLSLILNTISININYKLFNLSSTHLIILSVKFLQFYNPLQIQKYSWIECNHTSRMFLSLSMLSVLSGCRGGTSNDACKQNLMEFCFIKILKFKSNSQKKMEQENETQSWQRVFTKPHVLDEKIYNQSQIILKSHFFTDKTLLYEDVQMTLVSNAILISQTQFPQNGSIGEVGLSFDLKFYVIHLRDDDIHSPKIGIKLFLENQRQFSFYSKSSSVVQAWQCCLFKKINQVGFHELFRPLKKLGKGNFATVYEVKRLLDNKLFAVKAFSKQACYNAANGKQGLINQLNIMRILSQNQHSNVIQLEGVFESDNSVYVVLELLNGPQFFTQILQRSGYFKSSQVRQFMFGLISGLSQLHNNRILHRDIKPQNIMLRSKDSMSPVIVDFGLSTQADLKEYLFFRCGTPGYVAPQIVHMNENKHVEPQCDVFSAGAIFHFLLVRKPLFDGTSCEQVYKKNKQMKIDFKHERYAHVTTVALDLLGKMLKADPNERLTAYQALKHPYFAGYSIEESPVKEISSPVLTAMSYKCQLLENTFLKK